MYVNYMSDDCRYVKYGRTIQREGREEHASYVGTALLLWTSARIVTTALNFIGNGCVVAIVIKDDLFI